MSIFKRKKDTGVEKNEAEAVQVPVPAGEDEDEGEIAAVIAAAVHAAADSAGPVNLVVRRIVRVSDQGTNWNRLILNEQMK